VTLAKRTFVVGLVIAILVSSTVAVAATLLLINGIQESEKFIGSIAATVAQGPKGDKGDTGATGLQGPAGPQGPQGETGATGPQGPKGDTGATGPVGPQGQEGVQGSTGPRGSMWYSGNSTPSSSTGVAGDFYLNTATGDIYNRNGNEMGNAWFLVGNLKGKTGYYSVYSAAGSSVDILGITNGDFSQTDPNVEPGYPNKLGWTNHGRSSWDSSSVTLYP